MIPNPVQRRRNARHPDESCAPEGGVIHEPVPIPEYSLPTWAAALIVVLSCAAYVWWDA